MSFQVKAIFCSNDLSWSLIEKQTKALDIIWKNGQNSPHPKKWQFALQKANIPHNMNKVMTKGQFPSRSLRGSLQLTIYIGM